MTAAPRCATHPEREWLWFSTDPDAQDYAKAICNRCPVQAWCLEQAPADDGWTIRAGLTPAERQALRPKARIRQRVRGLAEHKTNARYVSGCRCRDCQSAHARYVLGWRAKGGSSRRRAAPRWTCVVYVIGSARGRGRWRVGPGQLLFDGGLAVTNLRRIEAC